MDNLYHSVSLCPASKTPLYINGNLFLAPVAGYSDRAFRSLCCEGGANFTYTEMVSSEALVRNSDKTELLMLRAPNEKQYGVQLFGGKPAVMAQASRIVMDKVRPELIDINAGCPVQKIIKTEAGSFLTKNPEKLYALVKAVVDAVGESSTEGASGGKLVPVTVKIRSGWNEKNLTWKEAALAAKEAGAAALTIHPRTRTQGYEGRADWQIIADLVQLVSEIPVFGSGDVFTPEDARSMLRQTGCAAVMFARGAMGNPFVFSLTRQLLEIGSYEPASLALRLKAALKELEILSADKGEKSACLEMRKRFCAYIKGFEGGKELKKQAIEAKTIADYQKIFHPLIVKTL